MKKMMLLFLCVLALPSASPAQEKTLYDISSDSITLLEAYAACAERDTTCTADVALSLQADAKKSLRDLVQLIRSGNLQAMHITADQAYGARGRVRAVQDRLAQVEVFEAQCNQAIMLLEQNMHKAFVIFGYMVLLIPNMIFSPELFPQFLVCIPLLFFYMAAILGSFVFLAPCLFWWL